MTATGERLAPSVEHVIACLRVVALRSRLLGLTNREPTIDFEQEIRRAALAAGEDGDEAVREALALLRNYERQRPRGSLKLLPSPEGY